MGRRSRKRGAAGAGGSSTRAERDAARSERAEAAAAGEDRSEARQTAVASARRRSSGERPTPPWGSFPLTELVVLLGLLLAVGGLLVGVEAGRGRAMFGAGVALGALGGLEIVVRDHFAGYRSHTTLLSGVAAFAVVTAAVLLLREVAPEMPPYAALSAALVAGAIVFGLAFRQLRRLFQNRSGGLSYR